MCGESRRLEVALRRRAQALTLLIIISYILEEKILVETFSGIFVVVVVMTPEKIWGKEEHWLNEKVNTDHHEKTRLRKKAGIATAVKTLGRLRKIN